MNYVKAAEQQFPIAQKDLTEIMSKPGVKPTYNFASIVNHSPTLQRFVKCKSLNSNGKICDHGFIRFIGDIKCFSKIKN